MEQITKEQYFKFKQKVGIYINEKDNYADYCELGLDDIMVNQMSNYTCQNCHINNTCEINRNPKKDRCCLMVLKQFYDNPSDHMHSLLDNIGILEEHINYYHIHLETYNP
jgi:hypothetical protein